jgi:hypothetical protein
VRLVIEELRTDVTKTRKDGTRGCLRIDYGDHRNPEAALQWLWKFVDDAKTAGELYGRALMVIAAEQHATQVLREMARPGLEPGTPRFSGSRRGRRSGSKRLQFATSDESLRGGHACGLALFRAGLGLRQAGGVPNVGRAPSAEPTAGGVIAGGDLRRLEAKP